MKAIFFILMMVGIMTACGGSDSSDDSSAGATGATSSTGDTTGATGEDALITAEDIAGAQCAGYPDNMMELIESDPCLYNVCMWADVVVSYQQNAEFDAVKKCYNEEFLSCHESCTPENSEEMSNDCGKDKLQACISEKVN